MKAGTITNAVLAVTNDWAKQRKAEERSEAARERRLERMTRPVRRMDQKEAAARYMEQAYNKVSDDGRLPAKARQIMYAARPYIQDETGKPLSDAYFTQTLLPDYIRDHPGQCHNWNVVFDARGHFVEPFTGLTVPLGHLEVRNYLGKIEKFNVPKPSFSVDEDSYPTMGPDNRYGAILFIEKEGFNELLRVVKLEKRYDIAVMSTKGMSVTAARELLDMLCAGRDLPVFVLHDFDKDGFSIFATLHQSGRRYTFTSPIHAIDIGLRLDDVKDMDLQSEKCIVPGDEDKVAATLKANGATEEEIKFLLKDKRRVELNAMTSRQLVEFIEGKLDEHGVAKVVPDDTTLADAYQRMHKQKVVQAEIDFLVAKLKVEQVPVPDDLQARITDELEDDPAKRWDEVMFDIVKGK